MGTVWGCALKNGGIKNIPFLLRATVVGRIGSGNFGIKNIPFLQRATVVGRIRSGNFGVKNIPFLLRATIRHEMTKVNSARVMKI
ncbi:MAG: hypothetical protein HG458_007395 [Prevotella sp.]|nr:hypothetical protein [Prevotella sp.]